MDHGVQWDGPRCTAGTGKKLRDEPERLFVFRLCLALGQLHPEHLLQSLTSRQFAEWMAFYSIDPFGDQRADLRAGIVAATMSNRWRGKNENPASASDFMPFRGQSQQTPDEIKRALHSILKQVSRGKSRHDQY